MKPIKIIEIPILQDQQEYKIVFNSQTTTLHSHKFVSIFISDQQILLIDLETKNIVSQNVKADANLLHPNKHILVLRKKLINQPQAQTQTSLQIFELEQKVKLYSYYFNNDILHWKWISDNEIDIIIQENDGDIAIKRVNIETQKIKKIINFYNQTLNTMIINYDTFIASTTNEEWGILTQIKEDQIVSQLFLVQKERVQQLSGCCCCFSTLNLTNDYELRDFFLFIEKKDFQEFQLYLIEIGNPPSVQYKIKQQIIFQINSQDKNDVPLLMYVNKYFGLLFVISRRAQLLVFELRQFNLIYQDKISDFAIISGKPQEDTGNYYVITENGMIITISIDTENLIPYVIQNCPQIKEIQQLIKHWQ